MSQTATFCHCSVYFHTKVLASPAVTTNTTQSLPNDSAPPTASATTTIAPPPPPPHTQKPQLEY